MYLVHFAMGRLRPNNFAMWEALITIADYTIDYTILYIHDNEGPYNIMTYTNFYTIRLYYIAYYK